VARRDNVILVVGMLEPRKNGPFVLDWFADTRVLPPGTELWWAGPPGWLGGRPGARRRWPPGRTVRFLGMVSDRRLCALYRRAAFTLYPSLYEGFGFPVLDSLRHGAPVLSSFHSSLREFAGPQGVQPGVFYFDPCDRASLDDACGELLAAGVARVGRADLGRFSWDGLARTVLSLCAAG
jgi:glycosyltransferase involved in cell wall biosynthesis